MNKLFSVLLILTAFCSCKNQEEKVADKKEVVADSTKSDSNDKKFEMYQMSEMAALMEQMYAHNASVKEKISKGENIGTLPDFFEKINTAKFTDESDNDLFFKQNAALFLNAQELIYSDSKNAKEHYNAGIDACITCHKSKCGGPIPRIKKLYLK